MTKTLQQQCFGCSTFFQSEDNIEHYQFTGIGRYGIAIPECLKAFFDILARECELYEYPPAHRLVIDAYAVQHPRHKEWQEKLKIDLRLIDASIQSIAVHLLALYCAIELKMELLSIAKVMGTIVANIKAAGKTFNELEAPKSLGLFTVADFKNTFFAKKLTQDEYTILAFDWAHAAWNAWSDHHLIIREWYQLYSKQRA